MYDYLIVGSGLFGSVFAHEAKQQGKKCLVIERRSHIGGNVYTEKVAGIHVHKYGAHIFHTANRRVWDYIHRFAEFNHYVNAPIARYGDELYNLPLNMNTFSKMWNITTPEQAKHIIAQQRQQANITVPSSLEEQAISLVGWDVYQKLIKGYTEKQWGRDCRTLPPSIIQRIPVRFTYDNNYFNDPWQGIPLDGYTSIIEKMLKGTEVLLNTDYFDYRQKYPKSALKTVYTGMLDGFFHFSLGHLEWRSLRFEQEELDTDNWQGNAVVHYTSRDVPWTRIIEHKHFVFGTQPTTVITREYPMEWTPGHEPAYPITNHRNNALADRYRALASHHPDVIFGGRLGSYRYYNMDQVIASALDLADREFGRDVFKTQ